MLFFFLCAGGQDEINARCALFSTSTARTFAIATSKAQQYAQQIRYNYYTRYCQDILSELKLSQKM